MSVYKKKALSIIAPDKSYKRCLVSFGLSTLYDRRNDQCIKLFNSISSDQHKFACLLSPNLQGYYNTRQERVYALPHFRTNRCKIPSNQPCAVVQTCYYNFMIKCYYVIFPFFFSSSLSLFLINKIEISLLLLFYTFYCIVNN